MSDLIPTVVVDSKPLITALASANTEVARALRNALNDAARDVQKSERDQILTNFVLKKGKPFLLQSVKIPKEGGFATKERLEVHVQIDPSRDHLAKFEREQDVGPTAGKYVALPTKQILKGEGGHVKAGLSFRKIAQAASSETNNKRAFWRRLPDGRMGLFRRVGRKGELQLLYSLRPTRHIRPILKFVETAHNVIPALWEKHGPSAVTHALRRAGLLPKDIPGHVAESLDTRL